MSEKENIILVKSYEFALSIIRLYKNLIFNQKEYDIGRQLLRSGTSVGANAEEAAGVQSRKDFIAKLSVAYKESRETKYWLRLLNDSEIINPETAANRISDCEEIQKYEHQFLRHQKHQIK